MHTRSKRNPIMAPLSRTDEIILFLINESWNQECCHGNKIFYIVEPLSSCTKFYLILTSKVWRTFDLNTQFYKIKGGGGSNFAILLTF